MKNEDALICDFAETYHILDYKRLPLGLVASLAAGLRDNSRSKMILNDERLTIEQVLLATMVDSILLLAWTRTKEAEKVTCRPPSVLDKLLNTKKEESAFASGKEFDRARDELIKKMKERGA